MFRRLRLISAALYVRRYVMTPYYYVKWFQDYLTGRSQYVRIGSTKSSARPITHGVPQGAILSPLLFCIYINDLPGSIQSCNLDSYVDDSKLYKSFCIYDLEQTTINLEADLQIAAKWCLEHQLLINAGKTKFLLVGSRPMLQKVPTEMSLTFLGKTIRPVLLAEDLGINLDSYLFLRRPCIYLNSFRRV